MQAIGANQDGKHHLKGCHPSDHTESMKMGAHVSLPTSFDQRPCGSSAVGSASGAVPQQQSMISKECDVIVVTVFKFYLHYFNKLQGKQTCIVLLRQMKHVCTVKCLHNVILFFYVNKLYSKV